MNWIREKAQKAKDILAINKAIGVITLSFHPMFYDEAVRFREFKKLKKFDLDFSLPYWKELVKYKKNAAVREQAIAELGKIGSEKAIPLLIEKLNDENLSVKLSAVRSLGEIGSEKAVPHLISKLMPIDSVVRKFSANALENIKKKLLEKGKGYGPNQPELFALMHISPLQHPKAFDSLLKELKKGKNIPEKKWRLTAKQLTAVERQLK
ncbi:HEAT repeat domain-containing protein [Candidatus Micrarchaeota archaeon]|nr:HEAT repeat domain-containing protein [Candidatus Micrarchaeota archaeon]